MHSDKDNDDLQNTEEPIDHAIRYSINFLRAAFIELKSKDWVYSVLMLLLVFAGLLFSFFILGKTYSYVRFAYTYETVYVKVVNSKTQKNLSGHKLAGAFPNFIIETDSIKSDGDSLTITKNYRDGRDYKVGDSVAIYYHKDFDLQYSFETKPTVYKVLYRMIGIVGTFIMFLGQSLFFT